MFSRMIDRWASISTREQYLIVILLAIFLLFVAFRTGEITADARAELRQLSVDAARAGDGIDKTLWQERAKLASDWAMSWETASWKSQSVGIIQAKVQRRLLEIATEAGITSMNIEVDRAPIAVNGSDLLRFRLTGIPLYKDSMAGFLAGITANPKRLIIDETAIFFKAGDAGRVSITGVAPILLEPVSKAQPEGTGT